MLDRTHSGIEVNDGNLRGCNINIVRRRGGRGWQDGRKKLSGEAGLGTLHHHDLCINRLSSVLLTIRASTIP